MQTSSRIEISKICQKFNIPDERFEPVSIHKGILIQDTILDLFCRPNSSGLLWERLTDTFEMQFIGKFPIDTFLSLVDHNEKIWLLIEETVSTQHKYWLYDGYIKVIVKVLKKTKRGGEVYIVSKKCDWLLCLTSNSCVIAAGKAMTEKLTNLAGSAED
jgi:hypothetical protein